MELKGKTAFITGGGGGIGSGIAEAFLEKGMRCVLTDIDLGFAEAEAMRLGKDTIALQHDVTSLESWRTAREAAMKAFGAIDVLCNNAGIATAREPLDQVSPETFARVMAINVTGVHNGIITFVPEMRARKSGHVVNTSSLNGLIAHATFGAYSASKFAVTALSDALRDELAPFGVGVSALFPGLTRSRMSTSPVTGAQANEIAAQNLAANMMEPVWLGRQVAKAIEENRPYIISHPVYKPMLEERYKRVLDAFGAPAQPGFPAAPGFKG
jgi:NAD(P)-dependent dehydrogenase (short-subunit alcohol dehydrogenase family)